MYHNFRMIQMVVIGLITLLVAISLIRFTMGIFSGEVEVRDPVIGPGSGSVSGPTPTSTVPA